MDPYSKNIFTDGYPVGSDAAKPSPFKRKYVATIYQGDVAFISSFRDSIAFATGTNLPTGSVCYINSATGNATPGVGTASATNCPIPYIVYMGTDQASVISQKGNAAGGMITAIPCTGYFRIVTTVFDTTKIFVAGDYLTATTATVNGLSTVGVLTNGATVYTDTVVGIADGPIANDHFGLPSLRFTCHFIPPTVS